MAHKLFITTGIFHPEPGGPATYLKEILPHLQQRNWEVRLQTYGDVTEHVYSYPVTRIKRRALPVRLAQYGFASHQNARWADLIYAHTIDLPVVWGDTPRVIKIVGDQAWERCIRMGWIEPTEDIDDFQVNEDYGRTVNWQRESRARQVQDFDGVIVPSDYLRRMVIGWGVDPSQVHVVYNALPPSDDLRQLPTTQAAAREHLGWETDETVFFFAGRLTAWKGVDSLIRAVRRVRDCRLVVAGDGDYYDYLYSLAAPAKNLIEFTGNVARERVYTMMRAADYFVLYSGYEGLPHTLLEALRVGTPVIASDKGGNPEVVEHGVNGLLVPFNDVDALADTLEQAKDRTQRTEHAVNTMQGMEKFAFETMVEETDAILRQYVR